MYSHALSYAGFDVSTAVDIEAGYELATSLHPSIVVMDFRLPDGSGTDLCSRLRRNQETSSIPMLLVTASSQRSDLELAREQGCSVVRLKPYLPDEMERDIRALISGAHVPYWPAEYGARES